MTIWDILLLIKFQSSWQKNIKLDNANILIMGLTFKENCPDIRNTKVIDLINTFDGLNCNVDVYDPWIHSEDALNEYNIQLIDKPYSKKYDAIVLAVAHDKIKKYHLKNLKLMEKITMLYTILNIYLNRMRLMEGYKNE